MSFFVCCHDYCWAITRTTSGQTVCTQSMGSKPLSFKFKLQVWQQGQSWNKLECASNACLWSTMNSTSIYWNVAIVQLPLFVWPDCILMRISSVNLQVMTPHSNSCAHANDKVSLYTREHRQVYYFNFNTYQTDQCFSLSNKIKFTFYLVS